MPSACAVAILAACVFSMCHSQQAIDPAYLQQYYQQVASQAGHRAAAGAKPEATPIFEPISEQSPQFVQPGQQIRIRDNVQDQVRVQQHQKNQQTQAYAAPQVRQYVQQPQSYVQQPQASKSLTRNLFNAPASASIGQGRDEKLDEENPDNYDPNPSYQFGFDVKDDEFTNYQNRKESREGNVITGSYSVVDSDGFIRTVKYTADPKEGFKAEVIREPTDIVVKIPTPAPRTAADQYLKQLSPQRFISQPRQVQSSQPQYQYQQ